MLDVIIIGAGPAGCAAARTLALCGKNVLLAEKFKIPRYKSCSGMLIEKSIKLVRACFGSDIAPEVMCTPTENKGMILTDAWGNTYTFGQSGLNIWRSSFDKWLADKAVEAGAELVDETYAASCTEEDGAVTVTFKGEHTYTKRARYVINCEGAVCALKHRLTHGKCERIVTYQTYNTGSIDLDKYFFHAWLQPQFSEYDAWFNVKDEKLVLGVAVKNAEKAMYYYSQFISYLKENHGLVTDRQLRCDKWIMPRIRGGCKIDYGIGRVLFAGDAAGFLSPMGEGISAALESGCLAAKAILHHFDDQSDVMDEYRLASTGLRSYMQRQWNLVSGMSDAFGEMKL